MLFRNQLDSLDNDSSCMGNKLSCDWCGSICQYNTALKYNEQNIPCDAKRKKHVMYCIDYLFQFRVYIWGGTERTSLQRRWWGMERKGEVCNSFATATKARSHRLHVLFNQNLLWTQERQILHLCQLLCLHCFFALCGMLLESGNGGCHIGMYV